MQRLDRTPRRSSSLRRRECRENVRFFVTKTEYGPCGTMFPHLPASHYATITLGALSSGDQSRFKRRGAN